MTQHYLAPLFQPESVAVFADEDTSNILLRNLVKGGYSRTLYPINCNAPEFGITKRYSGLDEVPGKVDMAVIAMPADQVVGIMHELGRHKVPAAVVISAGFRDVGAAGEALEDELKAVAKRYNIRFIGPNCLGVMNPHIGMNATYSNSCAPKGKLALVSQSGALCTAILDWAEANAVGFSKVVSTGLSADIDCGEVLDYLITDPKTVSILLYVESIRDARHFMSSLRAASRIKPVIVMKSGRHDNELRETLSHTSAIIGSDDVFDAALCRSGVVRITQFSDLFSAAKTLSSGLKTRGSRLAIVTNGGGPGLMAADKLAERGLPMLGLTKHSIERLNEVLPETWSHGNPIDITGNAPPSLYREVVSICMDDPNIDATMVILTPLAKADPYAVAEEVAVTDGYHGKPLLTCWMGAEKVRTSRRLFQRLNIPTFRTPEATVEAFYFMAAHQRNQQLLLQTPDPLDREHEPDLDQARRIINRVLEDGRTLLSELESKKLLRCFHIRTGDPILCRSEDEAVFAASRIGYPVVMKVYSPDITHKSDVGGVRLNIHGDDEVRSHYQNMMEAVAKRAPQAQVLGVLVEKMHRRMHGRELMIGVLSDPIFGSAISFGSGGTMVEVMNDQTIALPPLNQYLARSLISNTKVYTLLGEYRHLPAADIHAVEDVLLRTSEMICELPELREMDINPLLADEEGAIVLDARIVVRECTVEDCGKYEHMAIHPYPSELVLPWTLHNGTPAIIRPIRPEDAQLEREFFNRLSDESRYFRFMYHLHEVTPEMISRFTQIDYEREMALVANILDEEGEELELGVARYVRNPDGESCEFAVVVADAWTGQGVATRLMRGLMDMALRQGLHTMHGDVLRNNYGMLKLMKALGFTVHPHLDDYTIVRVTKDLDSFRWYEQSSSGNAQSCSS